MELINKIFELIASGSGQALNAFLFGAVVYLLWERRETQKMMESTNQRMSESREQYLQSIERILDKYHEGNLEMVQALHEIQVVLSAMQKSL